MTDLSTLRSYIDENQNRFLTELTELLKIPTISAQEKYKEEMNNCAGKLASLLQKIGLNNVEVMETQNIPCVYGEYIKDEKLPTVLVYGHYDVQPPDPINLWESPPFEPEIREGKIFARGAADDKGQFLMHILALEWMINEANYMPCNVKIIIEGEEEIGSPSLGDFLVKHKEKLACDVLLISDSAMHSFEHPTIDVGMRGLSYLEIELTGPSRDLHSGVYGGAVPNPITILCKMLATLHNDKNEITIPHFYDEVEKVSEEERKLLAQIPKDKNAFLKETGCLNTLGEEGYATHERIGIRPTLEINGIWGGYTEDGAKTVLPSKAFAKISCRLVPHQQTDTITHLIIEHLNNIAPPYIKIKVTPMHGGDPYVLPIDDIGYKAASKALETTFGKTPLPMRGGGSIPIVPVFERVLNAKTVFLGFGLNDDGLHSPNEKFNIANFLKGIETIPFFYQYFASLSK